MRRTRCLTLLLVKRENNVGCVTFSFSQSVYWPVSSPLAPLTPSPVWAVGGFSFFFLKDRLASWDSYLHPQKDKPSQINIPAGVFFFPSCKIPSSSSYHGSQPHVFRKTFSSSFVLINPVRCFFSPNLFWNHPHCLFIKELIETPCSSDMCTGLWTCWSSHRVPQDWKKIVYQNYHVITQWKSLFLIHQTVCDVTY